MYFLSKEDPRKRNGWIGNPFFKSKHQLSVSLENQLQELAADGSVKIRF